MRACTHASSRRVDTLYQYDLYVYYNITDVRIRAVRAGTFVTPCDDGSQRFATRRESTTAVMNRHAKSGVISLKSSDGVRTRFTQCWSFARVSYGTREAGIYGRIATPCQDDGPGRERVRIRRSVVCRDGRAVLEHHRLRIVRDADARRRLRSSYRPRPSISGDGRDRPWSGMEIGPKAKKANCVLSRRGYIRC